MASYWWWLAAAPIGVVVVGLLLIRPRKTLAGDMEFPMDVEKGRAKSEAKMAAPADEKLPEAEAGEAAVLVAFHRELATDEQPIVPTVRKRHVYRGPTARQLDAMRSRLLAPTRRFEADPLSAPIPDLHLPTEPVLFTASVVEWFGSAPSFVAPLGEPEPLPPLDFTGDYYKATDLARLVAEAKAGASR